MGIVRRTESTLPEDAPGTRSPIRHISGRPATSQLDASGVGSRFFSGAGLAVLGIGLPVPPLDFSLHCLVSCKTFFLNSRFVFCRSLIVSPVFFSRPAYLPRRSRSFVRFSALSSAIYRRDKE